MTGQQEPYRVAAHSLSRADALGYRGQQAIANAVGDSGDYRIIGGHMVRLLQLLCPTPRATARSTTDADAALEDVEVVGSVTRGLLDDDFVKEGGNILYKDLGDQRIEVNLLLQRADGQGGLRTQIVEGIGQVDTLPELAFALMQRALTIDVEAHLETEVLNYRIRIPDLEAATVLKAHSWKGRRSRKDLVDLYTLLEIREEHPAIPWRLKESEPIGFRRDTARILTDLAPRLTPRRTTVDLPVGIDRLRFASLISKHVTAVDDRRGS